MKFLRILPETCARTWCLFSSSTLNMALGSGSITTAITSIASSLLIQLLKPVSPAAAGSPNPLLATQVPILLLKANLGRPPIPSKSPAHSWSLPRSVRSGHYNCRLASPPSIYHPGRASRARRHSPLARSPAPCRRATLDHFRAYRSSEPADPHATWCRYHGLQIRAPH